MKIVLWILILLYALVWVFVGYFSPLGPVLYQYAMTYYKDLGFRFETIWLNNLIAASVFTLGGYLAGLPILAGLAVNMALMGAVARVSWDSGRFLFFWGAVLPHGIIELPVIFYSAFLGLSISLSLFKVKGFDEPSRRVLFTRFVSFVPLSLAVAAAVEVYITPSFARLFL